MVDHTSLYKLKKRIGVDKLRIIINEEFIFLGSGKVAQLGEVWLVCTKPWVPSQVHHKTKRGGT